MPKSEHSDIQTPSTVEAIKMASVSVLGTTTKNGFPIGSATGSGSMMEQNSETVAMNIAPLIFAVRDTLYEHENLELFSMEWDLERAQGPEVLPEHLVVAGGRFKDVKSNLCTLSWEKGVVDPFRVDEHLNKVAQKLSDIEEAVLANELDYESEGVSVLRRFSDRFNGVTFVDMLDRQFQGSWSSVLIKPEHVDTETIIKMGYRDDFATSPPGPRIISRESIEFRLPMSDSESQIQHFMTRIISPTALTTLSAQIPEMGQAILGELNSYAYSTEEVDIARTTIAVLVKHIGRELVQPSELENLQSSIDEFIDQMTAAVDVLSEIVEAHAKSGAKKTLDQHKSFLIETISQRQDETGELGTPFAKALVEHLMLSVQREYPVEGEIRAWQLRGIFSYFTTFAKRVMGYFSDELKQFLMVESVKKVLLNVLQDFRVQTTSKDLNPTESMIFHKLFAELYSIVNAIADRISFDGTTYDTMEDLIAAVARETTDAFVQIDILTLIGFNDMAEAARREIKGKFDVTSEPSNDESGSKLNELLRMFETFVSETLPDVGETILSKQNLIPIIREAKTGQTPFLEGLNNLIELQTEKPEEWLIEAKSWLADFREHTETNSSLGENLLIILKRAYDRLGQGATAQAMVNRIRTAYKVREEKYQESVKIWEAECKLVDEENVPIKQHNDRRAELLQKSKDAYEADMKEYETELENFTKRIKEMMSDSEPVSIPEPKKPESLEDRRLKIMEQYPVKEEKGYPPKPQRDAETRDYLQLKEIFESQLSQMEDEKSKIETVFNEKLGVLRLEGAKQASEVSVNISVDFLEYLMNARIRKIGRVFPKATRVYLRSPNDPGLIYLVSYEHHGNSLLVTIGNNYLRRD